MCLISYRKFKLKSKAEIAAKEGHILKQDIFVFKWLFKPNGFDLVTPWRGKRIEKGKMYTSRFETFVKPCPYWLNEDYFKFEVEKGLHSYDMKYHTHISKIKDPEKYYIAMIPKGSKIYIGEYGEIASSRLMILTDEQIDENIDKIILQEEELRFTYESAR